MTDANGELYEHVEYFPFGETWVQEHSNTQRTPYLYTGKELDEETQLYYYGARYYDPRTSVWQSADPILGEYLNGKRGMGGVYNPLNLGLYAYTHQNPIRLVDPDGQAPGDPFESPFLAARDFAITYNDDSIRQKREYGTAIYGYINSEGKTMYSYKVPTQGINTKVHIDTSLKSGQTLMAKAHTHGSYKEGYGNSTPSDTDYDSSVSSDKALAFDFLVGNDGSLTAYGFVRDENGDPLLVNGQSRGGLSLGDWQRSIPGIDTSMIASDPNNPNRKTAVDPGSGVSNRSVRDKAIPELNHLFNIDYSE